MTFTLLDPEADIKCNSCALKLYSAEQFSVITVEVISCCLCLHVLTFMPAHPPALAFSVSVWYHSLMWLTHRLAYLKGGELMFMSSSWQGGETLG